MSAITGPNQHVQVSQATAADLPFIRSSWLESYARSHTRWSLGDDYYSIWAPIITMLLKRSTVFVAKAPADPDFVVGWIVFESPTRLIHYLYVRGSAQMSCRRAGVAKALSQWCEGDGWTATHATKLAQEIMQRRTDEGRGPVIEFAPLLDTRGLR